MVGCWSSCWRAVQGEIEKASITNRSEIMGKIRDLAARREERWRPKLMLSIIEGGRSRRKDCRGGGGLRGNRAREVRRRGKGESGRSGEDADDGGADQESEKDREEDEENLFLPRGLVFVRARFAVRHALAIMRRGVES